MLWLSATRSAAAIAFAAATMLSACAPVRMQTEAMVPLCRTVSPLDRTDGIGWISPAGGDDRKSLRSWCEAVGPVAVVDATETAAAPSSPPAGSATNRPLTIVSWNMAVGRGDLPKLLEEIRAEHPGSDVVFLLQEAYRAQTPPASCPDGSGRAGPLALPRPQGSEDIVDLAKRLKMHAVYAPSMRNGTDCTTKPFEDRGNAILSTLPLSSGTVIELPFAQQRRVAVAARVGSIGVITTHFDTLLGHERMSGAINEAAKVLKWTQPFIVGGDFNSATPLDSGLREMKKHFREADCGEGPTHERGARLDHMFVAHSDTTFECRTGKVEQRHGSDHSPLIAKLSEGTLKITQ